jgi:hypothetical protein
MINIAGTSGPPISGAVQQSSEADRDQQSSSQPQDLPTTMHAHAVTTTTSAGGTPVDDSVQQAGTAVVVQGPQQESSAHIAQGQNSAAGADESSYVIGCCGFAVHRVRPRPTLH